MKMEQTRGSETSAYKIQTPRNYPEESIQAIRPLKMNRKDGVPKQRIFDCHFIFIWVTRSTRLSWDESRRGQSIHKTFLSFQPHARRKHFAFADHHVSTKCTTVLHTCAAVTKSAACICDAFRARLNTLSVQSVPSATQHTKSQLHTFLFTSTLLQHYVPFSEAVAAFVTPGFRRGVNESSHFWDFTQGTLVIADVSEQPIGSIFKGQAVGDECL
jgi:hypothetical protein